jgi:hypothetical protein
MLTLKVLHTCPSQRNTLLSSLGSIDPCVSKVIKFDVMDVKPRLPYHVAFQIHVEYTKNSIKHTIIDEGVAMCVMSLTYWKAIGSLNLSQYMNMLTTFDGRSFKAHIILSTFLVQLGGKTVEVDVDMFDAPLDYNLLLGSNWTYSMIAVMPSVLRTLCFPHEGKIMMIDQLSFAHASPNASFIPLIPMIDNTWQATEDIGFRMYSSLMGIFDFMAPIHHIHSISNKSSSSMSSIPFHTFYFNDTWTLPSPTMSFKVQLHIGMEMSLSITEVVYQAILITNANPDPFSSRENKEDPVLKPVWAV